MQTVQVFCAYEQSKNHISLRIDPIHPMRRTCFDQYKASSAVLEWPGDVLCVQQVTTLTRYMLSYTLDFLAVMSSHCAPAQLNLFYLFNPNDTYAIKDYFHFYWPADRRGMSVYVMIVFCLFVCLFVCFVLFYIFCCCFLKTFFISP